MTGWACATRALSQPYPLTSGAALEIYDKCKDESVFSYGLYAPQLLSWFYEFDRKQFFVLPFEKAMAEPSATLIAIGSFMGFVARPATFPHLNDHESPYKVTTISCELRERMAAAYAPWNALLWQSVIPEVDHFDDATNTVQCGQPSRYGSMA